ncbi:hypothetical protein EON65_17460 [archaeon]|nr:MAG: hypothetical protein EON65_17460 [archaeon]
MLICGCFQNKEMSKKVRYINYPMYMTMTIPASFCSAPTIVLSDLLHQWILKSQGKVLSSKILSRIVEAIRGGGRKKKEGTGLRFITADFNIEVLATTVADDTRSLNASSQGIRQSIVSNDEQGEIELRLVLKTPNQEEQKTITQMQIKTLNFELLHPAFVSIRAKEENEQLPPHSFLLPVVIPNHLYSQKIRLELRFKKEGDHFSIVPRDGQGQRLSRILQAQQVPLTQRDRVLVLVQQCDGRNETIVGLVIDDSKILTMLGTPLTQLVVTRL